MTGISPLTGSRRELIISNPHRWPTATLQAWQNAVTGASLGRPEVSIWRILVLGAYAIDGSSARLASPTTSVQCAQVARLRLTARRQAVRLPYRVCSVLGQSAKDMTLSRRSLIALTIVGAAVACVTQLKSRRTLKLLPNELTQVFSRYRA